MIVPNSPLEPVRPDPAQKPRKAKPEARTVLHRLLIPMIGATIVAVVIGSVPLMVLGGAVWLFWGIYYVLLTQILQPSGSTTPSVNQHSNIEALVARGRLDQAAEAYRAAIAADPGELVACDKLGQMAQRDMKDYTTALFAWREAEKRSIEPKRQLGYAMLVAGIYRDNLKDYGRTVVELRRILDRYPDAPNAASLRAEIDELKATHFGAP